MRASKQHSILILSFTDHKRDPRVYRQINALSDSYRLTTAGIGSGVLQFAEHIELSRKKNLFDIVLTAISLKLGFYEVRYWRQKIVNLAFDKLQDRNFDVIFANDLETLPLALKLSKKLRAKIIFDAHEYEPRVMDDQFIFNFFFAKYYDYLCERYLSQADYITTVSDGIADEYKKNYKVDSTVVFNAPIFQRLSPTNLDSDSIKIIHHGIINRSRKLENMIMLVGQILGSGYQLDLMLINTDRKYMQFLKKCAGAYSNIRFLDPVQMPEIVNTINQYDIGMFLLPKDNFNHYWALPNKFFEFIQARLAVAVWPSPEMKRIVEQEKIGIVSEDFSIESMAIALKSLTKEKIEEYKKNADVAAKKYNADVCADQIREIVKGLLS
ncbi:MAG: glycosyltransferase [Chitinophagales bacterium]